MSAEWADAPEFIPWGKIPRLNRDIVITEKIDGTNAAVGFNERGDVWAQSRNRIITPAADNYGYAKWVDANAADLYDILGPGLHYGEWWGSGIQRGYGLQNGEKKFSLFNTHRWMMPILSNQDAIRIGLSVVPLMYAGPRFDEYGTDQVVECIERLRAYGSRTVWANGRGFYPNPEGIIVYHTASGHQYKVTLKDDGKPKGVPEKG